MASDRRFTAMAVVIGAVSTAVFAWMVTLGRWDLFAERTFSDPFDLQARAMLDGHLDVPAGSLGFEGFVVGGRTYTYFGLFPSVLRMPVLGLTDSLDGRLTTLSMLLAFVVAFASAALLVQRVRELVRPDRRWTTTGLVLAGLGLAAVGLSSNLTFLSSAAWVYHEAGLWGCAGVLGAFAVLAGYLRDPRPSRLAWAAVWTAVAWLSRGSVGLAPTLALGVTGAGQVFGWRPLQRFTPPAPVRGSARRAGVILLLGALVPMGAFMATNLAKFDSLFSIPFSSQVGNDFLPTRNDALEEYDGSLFSPTLVPAVAWQTFRPDLVRPSAQWPFVELTRRAPIEVGHPVWDTVEPSAGATVTMPLLFVLGAVGLVAAVRSRARGPTGALVALAPAALGAAAAGAVPFTIAFIAQRYITDLVPLVVLCAAAGIAVGDHWSGRVGVGRWWRGGVVAGAATLLVGGMWVTLSVTWLHQRFEAPPDTAAVAAGLRTQDQVAEGLSTPAVPVERRPQLPADPSAGRNVVVGDCAGLYRGDGMSWQPLEVTSAEGRVHLHVRWDTLDPTAAADLVSLVGDRDQLVVTLRRLDEERVVVGLLRDGTDVAGAVVPVAAGRDHDVVVEANPGRVGVDVSVDGTGAASVFRGRVEDPAIELGGEAASAGGTPVRLPATVTLVEDPTPTCDALTDGDP